MKNQQRNLKPHAEAVAAMYVYGKEYAAQGGGSMDFWDALHESKKDVCRRLVDEVCIAWRETRPASTRGRQ